MEALELLQLIKLSPQSNLLSQIDVLKHEIRLLFLRCGYDYNEQNIFESILTSINSRVTAETDKNAEVYQGLITHLGYYFKKANLYPSVQECLLSLQETPLKYRLKAFVFYKQYNNLNQHIFLFERLIKLYSAAITDEFEDYTNDVLIDLFEYKQYTIQQLQQLNQTELIQDFNSLFLTKENLDTYPILQLFQANQSVYAQKITISEYKIKIFEPSIFTEKLFNEKFINALKADTRTVWYHILLGYDSNYIRANIINYGQTNFDKIHRDLNSAEIVKLYCYYNMRMHFYSSIFLFERFSALINFYTTQGRIKFIDIGCGPATSGIALIDFFQKITKQSVIFDYYGIDYYQSMLNEASNMLKNEKFDVNSDVQLIRDLSLFQVSWLGNSECLIFNACYLFASDSLDEIELANSVNRLRSEKPFVPAFLLFQNTTDPYKNIKYHNFKKHITIISEEYSDNVSIKYNNRRNSSFEPTPITVFFEILKL